MCFLFTSRSLLLLLIHFVQHFLYRSRSIMTFLKQFAFAKHIIFHPLIILHTDSLMKLIQVFQTVYTHTYTMTFNKVCQRCLTPYNNRQATTYIERGLVRIVQFEIFSEVSSTRLH